MKNFLILIIVAYGGWQFYLSQDPTDSSGFVDTDTDTKTASIAQQFLNSPAMQTLEKAKAIVSSSYQCDERELCSQMNSFEEAQYFLKHCPNTRLDRNHNGTPCETRFNK